MIGFVGILADRFLFLIQYSITFKCGASVVRSCLFVGGCFQAVIGYHYYIGYSVPFWSFTAVLIFDFLNFHLIMTSEYNGIKFNKQRKLQSYSFIMKTKQTLARSLSYLGAAICEGQTVKGVERSPQLLRDAGLFGHLKNRFDVDVVDYGDVHSGLIDPSKYPVVNAAVRNLNILGPTLQKLHEKVYEIVRKPQNQFLLTVGGDHSIGSATIAGVKRHHENLKVIWIDAHPDLSNCQVRSKGKIHAQNYHGMPLSHVCGIAKLPKLEYFDWIQKGLLDPKNVVLVGVRDIDDDEFDTIKKYGIKTFTDDHIRMYGIGDVVTQAMHYLDPKKESPFHISLDIDGVDPEFAQQTGTRFRYGPSDVQTLHVVRRVAHERKLVSMDLVEINENLFEHENIRLKYRGEADLKRVSRTVGLGIDIVDSVFTKYFTL